MNIKKLFSDDRAVSPVIGVILMVAITVILAAVIGTFVLGLGDDLQDTSPTASMSFDFDTTSDGSHEDGAHTVTISHTGGDTISEGESLSASVTGDKALSNETHSATQDNLENEWYTGDGVSSGNSETYYVYVVDATGSVEGDAAGTHVWDGETVSVNWESVDGDSSATLGSSTAP